MTAQQRTLATQVNRIWWKEAIVYQIYPRSFMDSNGDGIGDLPGILTKLDYLKQLGVDVLWLSPIYRSPNDDNGYDISDYQSIMEEFGTIEDFQRLLREVHQRDMKLVMDLVVNHTSDEHPWFVSAKSSKQSPFRDYYIWRRGIEGREPNNWASFFGGSVWEYDEQSDEYYLHLFSKKQPDLNWENPIVRQEIFAMMNWWLEQGVDGFRMDVINAISKVEGLPDAPGENGLPYQWGGQYFLNGPNVHQWLADMHQHVLGKFDVMTVGETLDVTPAEALLYVGENRAELNMVFQFELMDIDSGSSGKWDAQPWKLSTFKQIFSKWQTELHGAGWNSLYLNNHDQPRLVSRFGDDVEYRVESAKMLATLLHTLQGTPFIYQGEEIGMTNVRFETIAEYRDIETLNHYDESVNRGEDPQKLMQSIYRKGRDNARTPMQWSAEQEAGFTMGTPWIAVNPNYTDINAAQALADDSSIYWYYQRLIQLRKQHPVIVYGGYRLLYPDHEGIYAYLRTLADETLLVLLNFKKEIEVISPWETAGGFPQEILLGNYPEPSEGLDSQVVLRPFEARVYRLR